MKKLLAIAVAISAIGAARVSAAETQDMKYFTVDESSIMIEEITDRGGTIPPPGDLPKPPSGPQINPPKPPAPGTGGSGTDWTSDVNNTVQTIDKIVNLMQKIFNIIKENQPVVDITTNYANAVPFGTSHWTQLQGWNKPSTKKYAFSMKNKFGSEVVKVVYQVHYTDNGNFQGKGKFLTGVTIEPISVTTAWGYNVTLVSEVPDSTIANVGTHDDPIASMQVQLKWTVHTILKDVTAKNIYYVQGDGFLQEIGTPFENAKNAANQKKMDAVKVDITTSAFN